MRIVFMMLLLTALAACGTDHGESVTLNGKKLYYLKPVTEAQARKVLAWLLEVNHNFGEPAQPFQLSKPIGKIVFRYPVQNDSKENIESNIDYLKTFSQKMSAEALDNQPIFLTLVDEDMKKIMTISSDN